MERELDIFRFEVGSGQLTMIFIMITTTLLALVIGLFVKEVLSNKNSTVNDKAIVLTIAFFLITSSIVISILMLVYTNDQLVDGVEEILHQYT